MKNYREVKIGPYSAYAIAKKNGFEGTEEEWLESLKPPAVDKTLTEEGQAADAKVTGDALATKAVIDDTTVGTDAWSAKHIIDTLCPPLEATGNPVTCEPVAGYPLGVVASWEPTQAGSGEPYPAGGGPNLLDISKCTMYGGSFGLVNAIVGDVLTIKGTVTSVAPNGGTTFFGVLGTPDTSLSGKGYKITAFTSKGSIKTIYGLRTETETAITIGMDLVVGQAVNVALRIMVSKDTPTAYAPYENIRPISGRDSVGVERCGENLLNITPFTKLTTQGVTYEYVANGGIHISGTALANVTSPMFSVWYLPPGKYYGADSGEGIGTSIVVHRNGRNVWLSAKGTFVILAGDVIKFWCLSVNSGATVDKTLYPYIVPGTTAPTAYAPYTGQTATMTLPRTIYGGTVDAVTGEGQETWKLVTLDGTERWIRQDNATNNYSCNIKPVANSLTNCLCSMLQWKMYAYASNGNEGYFAFESSGERVHFCVTETWETVDAWKSYLAAQYAAGTPVQIAYKPATPEPFTATGAQPIPALPGVNTLMTDADALTVTGRADPIKRITDLEDAVASMTNT